MYATLGLSVLLTATLCVASPFYQPQQRQLFYSAVPSVVPQYPQYSPYPAYQPYAQFPQYTPVAPAPAAFKQYYYAPQSSANLVGSVPSALRYPSAIAPAKQVIYYPGAAPYPLLSGDESSGEGSQSWQGWLGSYIPNSITEWINPVTGSAPATGEPAPAAPAPAETTGKEGEKEKENEKEDEENKSEDQNKVKAAPEKYVLVGQPQFYGLQPVNPAAAIPSPQNGAVSSYLLLKNYPGVRFASPYPQIPQVQQFPQVQHVPQQPTDAELIPAGSPGKAALSYYKLLQQAQTQASRQQKEYEDTAAVTVDADTKDAAQDDDKESANQEETVVDKEDDDEPGTKE